MSNNYPGLRAGQLRDLLYIEERIDRNDAAGAPLPADWRPIAKVWADLKTHGGFRRGEETRADQLITSATYKVTIRFRTDVTSKHRLTFIGPPSFHLNIIAEPQDPDGRRRSLVLVCEAGLTDG